MRSDVALSGQASRSTLRPDAAAQATRGFWQAVALQRAGRMSAAAQMLEDSLALDPRYSARWERFGDISRHLARPADARRGYENALELDPDRPGAHRWLSTLLLIDDETAIDDIDRTFRVALTRAQTLMPHDPRSIFWLAVAEEAAGDIGAARSHYRIAVDSADVELVWVERFAQFEAGADNWTAANELFARFGEMSRESFDGIGEDGSVLEQGESAPVAELDADWASTVAFYSTALAENPSDCDLNVGLGRAYLALEDWSGAQRAFRAATESGNADARTFDALSVSSRWLDDHATAVEAAEQALILEPTGHRYFQLALAYQRAGRAERSTVAFRHALRAAGNRQSWFDQLGALRRQTLDWAGAAALYRASLALDADVGARWYYLGFALERLGDWPGAIDAYQRAVDLDSQAANWVFRLGQAHTRTGATSIDANPRIGLVLGNHGDAAKAAACFTRATELDSTNPRYWSRLGIARQSLGEHESAVAAFERATALDPDDDSIWHLWGRSIAARANERGLYHAQEHDALERIWGRSIELAPGRTGSRHQLIRASIKAARWKTASDLAWSPLPATIDRNVERSLRGYLENPAAAGAIEAARATLGRPDTELSRVPREFWFALHWRLLHANHFTEAYRAKSLLATSAIAEPTPHPDNDLGLFLERTRAMVFLDRWDEALEQLQPPVTQSLSATARNAMRKQSADVRLLMGDVAPYRDMLALNAGANQPQAEDRFRSLISGKRVAIVGPAMTNLEHGAEIDDFDVVIRTKHVNASLADFATTTGTRTDLSYYALGSAQFLADDIVHALAHGDLRMAVLRTATHRATPRYLHAPGDMRYVPSEFSIGLRASQFAIQRIVYDILRYNPSEIKIFNINFFISADAYRPGYLAGYMKDHTEQGFVQVLGSFGHDFLADFKFTQELHRLGLIGADQDIDKLLTMSPDQYLAALDVRE